MTAEEHRALLEYLIHEYRIEHHSRHMLLQYDDYFLRRARLMLAQIEVQEAHSDTISGNFIGLENTGNGPVPFT